jgi:hypothetical protein
MCSGLEKVRLEAEISLLLLDLNDVDSKLGSRNNGTAATARYCLQLPDSNNNYCNSVSLISVLREALTVKGLRRHDRGVRKCTAVMMPLAPAESIDTGIMTHLAISRNQALAVVPYKPLNPRSMAVERALTENLSLSVV